MPSPKKVLVTGGDGQLGYALRQLALDEGELDWVFCSREDLDLMDDDSIRSAISDHAPDVVINAGAYTSVDQAEDERELAMRINGYAVGVIAQVSESVGAHLIQISTDYIFGGREREPYAVDHKPNPINYYGVTKLEGEMQALKNCSKVSIVRTQWLHSEHGVNFANTMRRLFHEKEVLNVVDDQIGRPTEAGGLARFCLDLILNTSEIGGVYHYGGEQVMSWCEFAKQLLADEPDPKITHTIRAISSDEYPTKAVRPKYSVLSLSKEGGAS